LGALTALGRSAASSFLIALERARLRPALRLGELEREPQARRLLVRELERRRREHAVRQPHHPSLPTWMSIRLSGP
jgi:hypothetical protein